MSEVVALAEAGPAPKSKLTLGWEPLALLLTDPDFAGALHHHHREMGHLPEAMPLLVDWAALLASERAGTLKIWTARVSGALAGMIAFQIHIHPFHLMTVRAMADEQFVLPRFRGKGVLYRRMWEQAVDALQAIGVRIVIGHDNAMRPTPEFFTGLGFEPMGGVYIKAL